MGAVNREPDDGARRAGGPDEFDAIVSRWTTEGSVPRWPDGDADPDPHPTAPAEVPGQDGDHFVPPEPPPLPRIGPPAAVGLVLLALGLVLCVSPSTIGLPAAYGLPLGLVVLAAGLGWLVLRLWPDPPPRGDGDGPDDGAVL
jgi:hypothetical protein